MFRFVHRSSAIFKSINAKLNIANQVLRSSSATSLCALEGVKVRMMSPLIDGTLGISSNSVTSSTSFMENVRTQDHTSERKPVQLLDASNDEHGGVIVELKDPMESDLFVASLRASLLQWRQQGKKGIWIKVPIELANLVEAAVKEGFRYHHAEPTYLMLVRWIPETQNNLPANVTHQVGVGAFVMNDKREILVVQEKIGKLHGIGLWKFPTGVINEGEDISVGAVREVKEETGIDTEFVEVLAFSESLKTFFEKSDLFFFCMLRPRSFEIQMQELEIEAAQWMPIEEYASQPFLQDHELLKYAVRICLAKIATGYGGFSGVPTTTNFSSKPSHLYLNSSFLNQSQKLEKDS